MLIELVKQFCKIREQTFAEEICDQFETNRELYKNLRSLVLEKKENNKDSLLKKEIKKIDIHGKSNYKINKIVHNKV